MTGVFVTGVSVTKYVPLIVLLGLAAAEDIRARRVPNWISFSLLLGGMALSFLPWGAIGPSKAMLGIVAGLVPAVVLYTVGAIGAGDLKLLAAIGAWLGPLHVIIVFAIAALIGMCLAIVAAFRQGKVRALVRDSVMLSASIAGGPTPATASAVSQTLTNVPGTLHGRTIPFAVAIAAGTIVFIGWSSFFT